MPKPRKQPDAATKQAIDNLSLELDKLNYIASHHLILHISAIAKSVSLWLGTPLIAFGAITGDVALVRVGVFVWGIYLLSLVSGVIAMLPGIVRINREHGKKLGD